MKASELRDKTLSELSEELGRQQRKMFGLRMVSRDSSNSDGRAKRHEFRAVRRDIARIKTVIDQLKAQAVEQN